MVPICRRDREARGRFPIGLRPFRYPAGTRVSRKGLGPWRVAIRGDGSPATPALRCLSGPPSRRWSRHPASCPVLEWNCAVAERWAPRSISPDRIAHRVSKPFFSPDESSWQQNYLLQFLLVQGRVVSGALRRLNQRRCRSQSDEFHCVGLHTKESRWTTTATTNEIISFGKCTRARSRKTRTFNHPVVLKMFIDLTWCPVLLLMADDKIESKVRKWGSVNQHGLSDLLI